MPPEQIPPKDSGPASGQSRLEEMFLRDLVEVKAEIRAFKISLRVVLACGAALLAVLSVLGIRTVSGFRTSVREMVNERMKEIDRLLENAKSSDTETSKLKGRLRRREEEIDALLTERKLIESLGPATELEFDFKECYPIASEGRLYVKNFPSHFIRGKEFPFLVVLSSTIDPSSCEALTIWVERQTKLPGKLTQLETIRIVNFQVQGRYNKIVDRLDLEPGEYDLSIGVMKKEKDAEGVLQLKYINVAKRIRVVSSQPAP